MGVKGNNWTMMTTVRIPAALRDFTDGRDEVYVDADSVDHALHHIVAVHPALRRHLYTEGGALRNYVNVFVNEDEIRTLDGLQTRVADGDVLFIVPSIAGG